MRVKNEKGSITIFVLVALLFMSAFLMISYANNVNKSKIAKEQFNIIDSVYYKENDNQSYIDAYTALRKKNRQVLTAEVENSNTLELTNTFEEKLNNYRIYGNGSQSNNLPAEYQEVEYIESTGTQWIDTLDIPNINKKYYIKYALTYLDANQIMFGSRSTGNYRTSQDQVYLNKNGSNQALTFYVGTKSNEIDKGITIDQIYERTFELSTLENDFNNSATYSIYLFGLNNIGTVAALTKMRLYEFTIYENSSVIKKFIPCYRKSDNVAGLYDVVEGKFYTNAGTGEFTKGSVLESANMVGDLVTDTTDSNYEKYEIPIKISEKSSSTLYDCAFPAESILTSIAGQTANYTTVGGQNKANLEPNKNYVIKFDYEVLGNTNINYYAGTSAGKNSTHLSEYAFTKPYYITIYEAGVSNIKGTIEWIVTSRDDVNFEEKPYLVLGVTCGNTTYQKAAANTANTGSIKITNVRLYDYQEGSDYNTDGESVEPQIYNIYLDSPLAEGDYIDFASGKVKRADGTEEIIDLPEVIALEDYTKIEVLTDGVPSKIEVEYVGYTLE